MRPLQHCFLVLKHLENPKGRLFAKFVVNHHTCILDHQEETTSEKSLPMWKFILLLVLTFQRLLSFNGFSHVGAYVWINIDR